jgi:hypothetical protein
MHTSGRATLQGGELPTERRYDDSGRLQVVLAAMIEDLRDTLSITMIPRMVTSGRTDRLCTSTGY